MSIRPWLTLPSFGLLALACGSDPAATTSESSSTGDGEDSSSSTDNPTNPTETTTPADSSSSGTTEAPTTTENPDSSSSTGEPLLCGNGDLDDGEECDDENTMDGDECSATCTVPYEVVWTATHNGSASNQDEINEVAIGPDGNIYVVGAERVTDEGQNLWLAQYMPDGSEGWTVSFNGLFGDDSGAALAFYDNGDIAVVGTSESEFDREDIFIARIDGGDQSVLWTATQDGPGMGGGDNDDLDEGSDIIVDGDTVYVTGHVRIGVQDWDLFVGAYDGDGVELWTQTYAGEAGGDDRGRALALDGDGNLWVAATERNEQDESVGLVLGFSSADGMPLDGETVNLDFRPRDMAMDADGNFVIGGENETLETFFDFVAAKYDPMWTETWNTTIDRGSDEFSVGVSIGATGNVYVAGTARAAAGFDAYLQVLDSAGARLWAASYTNVEAETLDDQFNHAVEDARGDVVAGGFESVLGEQRNGLLMKLSAL